MKSASEVDAKEAMLKPVNIGVGAPLAIASPIVGKIGWDLKEDGNDIGGVTVMLIATGLGIGGLYLLATAGECPEEPPA